MAVRYFYVATLAFTFGILVNSLELTPLYICMLLLGAVFIYGWVWHRLFVNVVWGALLIAGIFVSLGFVRMEYAWSKVGTSPLAQLVGDKVVLEGVVVREPERRERTLVLYVKTDTDVVAVFADRYETIQYGDSVKISGTLKKPKSFVTDLGRTFYYPGYLLARGVEYTISFPRIEYINSGQGNTLIGILLKIKAKFVQALGGSLPEPAHGLGVGLLLGVKSGLGSELEEAFRATGIIHIVVLSGYNILLVVTFVSFLLTCIVPPRTRLVCGLIVIICFALMVGLSATVVRACIMAAICLVAQTFGRVYEVLRGLLCAGMIMLIINPFLLVFDVGFQLSFLATLGLVLGTPLATPFLSNVRLPRSFKELAVATVVTQIAVLPVLLYQIGEFSIVSVLVNILVLPMVPVAMLLTFITGFIAILSPLLATILVYPTYLALQYIVMVAQFFASLPWAVLYIPAFSWWVVPISYSVMAYCLYVLLRQAESLEEISLEGWEIVEDVQKQ